MNSDLLLLLPLLLQPYCLPALGEKEKVPHLEAGKSPRRLGASEQQHLALPE